MNILFIVLPHIVRTRDAKNPKTRSYKAFPYGVLSIASYLKNHTNKEVGIKIIDCNLYEYITSMETIKNNLSHFKPNIVALSMNYDNAYKHLEDISRTIKEYDKNTIVILGGSAASFSYEEILNEQRYIDGICYTEGEIPVTMLVNSFKDNNNNKNMLQFLESNESWITKKSLKNKTIPQKTFVTNLDEVIDLDYSLINDMNMYEMMEAFSPFIIDNKNNNINKRSNNKKQFFLVTSRGCPYKCIFCATSTTLYNNKIRYANVDKVIEHVRHLVSKYGMNILTIYDDQLLLNTKRAKELFKRLAEFNLRIECPNGLSVKFIDDELAQLMRNAGMDTIILAIESGSKYMLEHIIHKPLKLELVKPTIKILRKYNFFIEGFFVIGIPGEKEEHRKETINFIREIELDWAGFNLATPMRGSELYNICIKNGYIDKNLKINEIEDKKYIINAPPHLIPEDISKKTYLMNLEINFVNNYRMKMGDYEIAAKCFQDVINRTTNHAFAYYYLAKAQSHLNVNLSTILGNYAKFHDIISKDKTWKEYAEYFGMNLLNPLF